MKALISGPEQRGEEKKKKREKEWERQRERRDHQSLDPVMISEE